MRDRRIDIINCPCCGAEYLANEIYIPNAFFGKPSSLEKDHLYHRIINDFGTRMNTTERYICDYCNTPFTVRAYIKFNVSENTDANMSKDYTVPLKRELF